MAQFEASENMSAGALRIENVSAGAFQVEKMSAGAFQIENMRSMKCHCGSGPDFDRPKLCFCMHEWWSKSFRTAGARIIKDSTNVDRHSEQAMQDAVAKRARYD